MLRIAEYNKITGEKVDLKELEKFGFIKYRSIEDGEIYYCICDLFIGKDRRILQDDGINLCKSIDYELSERELEIIYDLIQARISRKGVTND